MAKDYSTTIDRFINIGQLVTLIAGLFFLGHKVGERDTQLAEARLDINSIITQQQIDRAEVVAVTKELRSIIGDMAAVQARMQSTDAATLANIAAIQEQTNQNLRRIERLEDRLPG